MKRKIYLPVVALLIIFAACSPQSRLSSRLTAEWNVVKFESRSPDGSSSTIENAGTLIFRSGGQGTQSFTSAIAFAGEEVANEFEWKNTERTLSIKAKDAEVPKVWIVVKSQRTKQEWYSTDSSGNVQVMHIEKK